MLFFCRNFCPQWRWNLFALVPAQWPLPSFDPLLNGSCQQEFMVSILGVLKLGGPHLMSLQSGYLPVHWLLIINPSTGSPGWQSQATSKRKEPPDRSIHSYTQQCHFLYGPWDLRRSYFRSLCSTLCFPFPYLYTQWDLQSHSLWPMVWPHPYLTLIFVKGPHFFCLMVPFLTCLVLVIIHSQPLPQNH